MINVSTVDFEIVSFEAEIQQLVEAVQEYSKAIEAIQPIKPTINKSSRGAMGYNNRENYPKNHWVPNHKINRRIRRY